MHHDVSKKKIEFNRKCLLTKIKKLKSLAPQKICHYKLIQFFLLYVIIN